MQPQMRTLHRRLPRRLGRLVTLGMVSVAVSVGVSVAVSVTLAARPAQSAPAQGGTIQACPDDLTDIAAASSVVRIVKVAGLIDPVVSSHLRGQLRHAEETKALGLVIWMNSKGSVLDDDQYLELATALADSPIHISMWVGQSGSTARGGSAELLGVADLVGVSPGSTIGATGPVRLPATFDLAFGEATTRLEDSIIGADEAIQLGISAGPVADVVTIGPFAALTPGFESLQCQDPAAAAGDGPRQIPLTRAELTGLPITSQLFHTVSSPEVAYLFFAMGLALLIFELYTAGIGLAGVIGAVFLALGCYGLAVLPTRWWGIGLLLGAFAAMAVDIQTNVPRLYTALGLGAFALGTFTLYDGVRMSWVTVVAGLIGAALYAYTGMPSMVRTRFSTPTIGRRWMIGEMGEALTDVSPEGTVKIRDVAWRAVTNRATPVKAGEPVRVFGLDRLVLEIEPEEGGAKDYRQRG
jgi:membrane-bound serine protease (ClpP class)